MKLIKEEDRTCINCSFGELPPSECMTEARAHCLSIGTEGLPGWEPKKKRGRPAELRCAEFNRKLPCGSCPEFSKEKRQCLLKIQSKIKTIDDIHYCNPPRRNKYQRVIRSETVDVYDVLSAFNVTNPALQHLIKKALCAGLRGHKDKQTDMEEILSAAKRALELEENNVDA